MARTRWPSGPVTPWPLAQARQIRPAAPVGAGKPGARPAGRSQDNPSGAGRFGGQAGTQASDATPAPVQTHRSRPEAEKQGQKHYPHPPCRIFATPAWPSVVARRTQIIHFGAGINDQPDGPGTAQAGMVRAPRFRITTESNPGRSGRPAHRCRATPRDPCCAAGWVLEGLPPGAPCLSPSLRHRPVPASPLVPAGSGGGQASLAGAGT